MLFSRVLDLLTDISSEHKNEAADAFEVETTRMAVYASRWGAGSYQENRCSEGKLLEQGNSSFIQKYLLTKD